MWSFQDLEVLSEENGDDKEYGMARNACNDVQIIYSSITFMCARIEFLQECQPDLLQKSNCAAPSRDSYHFCYT